MRFVVWILAAWFGAGAFARMAGDEPLVPPAVRLKLRTLGAEIAKSGDAALLERFQSALRAAGDPDKDLERLRQSWDKTLERSNAAKFDGPATAKKLRRELKAITSPLAQAKGDSAVELANWMLTLDSEDEAAHAALGHVREQGAWFTAEEAEWRRNAGRIDSWRREASVLPIEIERRPCTNPLLATFDGEKRSVASHGIVIHSQLPLPVLERVLRQALRTAALSNAILHGKLEVPKLERREFVFLDTDARIPAAVAEARTKNSAAPELLTEFETTEMRSFVDNRGWRTSRWRTESDFSALIVWESIASWIGATTQPCLRIGHLNWLCLEFLGTCAPWIHWQETNASSGAITTTKSAEERNRDALWRAARHRLHGCRSWMAHEVRAGRNVPWSRAFVDQDGKLTDETLLKATLVCAHLQESGRLTALIEATRKAGDRVAAFTGALGTNLPEFEEVWQRWLLGSASPGLVQALEGSGAAVAADPRIAAGLARLAECRARAIAAPELDDVTLEVQLSAEAAAHARYLTANPEQKTLWPQAHEEFPDRVGFSPAGARAGSRSVIAFGEKPAEAIDGWLGTFYHRLPLLHPGLFGVGFAEHDGTVVLDVDSLVVAPWSDHVVVWPVDGATDVPLSFAPELPNPVPGEDLSLAGYPVTVQLFFRTRKQATRLEMKVTEGESGRVIDAWFLSPEAPLFVDLVPQSAWCAIPKSKSKRRTRYVVEAKWDDGAKTWSFTTGG